MKLNSYVWILYLILIYLSKQYSKTLSYNLIHVYKQIPRSKRMKTRLDTYVRSSFAIHTPICVLDRGEGRGAVVDRGGKRGVTHPSFPYTCVLRPLSNPSFQISDSLKKKGCWWIFQVARCLS